MLTDLWPYGLGEEQGVVNSWWIIACQMEGRETGYRHAAVGHDKLRI